MKAIKYLLILSSLALIFSCGTDTATKGQPAPKVDASNVKIPIFSADSSYLFVEKQVSFGPRVPGTEKHKACKDWMVQKFKSFGADVIEQDFDANIYTGEKLASTNIIAQFNPKHAKRVLLAAHWDSRMIGDKDEDPAMRDKPILGADDGGSGVGVLLEVARLIQ